MSNIYFTADSHFWHKNVIKYCNRPFSSVEEMNEVMIERYNERVKPQDIVYFLGDFAFCNQLEVKKILERLNGNIHLIKGNHDKPLNGLHNYFESVHDLKTISVKDDSVKGGLQFIQMCHYPLLSFDRMHYGSWMLHGHCHNNIPFDPKFRRIDVGVDKWNFYPVSYEEIKSYLEENYTG
jgi:calcineurin-like phosphoesterase family protein